MAARTYNSHREHVSYLGFRRGANDRDAAGLTYANDTPWPEVIPSPPAECATDGDLNVWKESYRLGYVIGASDRDLQNYKSTDPQEVPEVFELPPLGPNEESPVAFADLLLTALLGREAGVLHAEHNEPETPVNWFIDPPGSRTMQADTPVALSPSLGAFRAVLARFGHHYMDNEMYAGHALRFLVQRGHMHSCHIYMSNNGQSGFWIEIYATRIPEPDPLPEGKPAHH